MDRKDQLAVQFAAHVRLLWDAIEETRGVDTLKEVLANPNTDVVSSFSRDQLLAITAASPMTLSQTVAEANSEHELEGMLDQILQDLDQIAPVQSS